jgi:hypothetical protein
MGKNLKYGEFDFGEPKTAMKKGGMCKTDTGYAKGGPKMPAKREPEAMVRKEVALLRKAKAPKAMIRHEMTEMSEPKALKNGGPAKVEAKLEKHANLPASKAHGPGAGNKLAKGGVPAFSKAPKFGKTK